MRPRDEAGVSTDPLRLAVLAVDDDPAVREEVYRNPSRPTELVRLLERAGVYAEDRWSEGETFNDWNGAVVGGVPGELLRKGAPADPTLTFTELAPLLVHGPSLRIVVAKHPATPSETKIGLCHDPSPVVREALATLDDLPAEAFPILAADPHRPVRMALARSERTPIETLRALLADENALVRGAAARNPRMTDADLAPLVDDRDGYCRAIAAERLTEPASLSRLARDAERDVRKAVAQNTCTPAEALDHLVATDPLTEHHVARHRNAGPALLTRLAGSKDWMIRENVAGNASAPPEALARLGADEAKRIRATVARNPKAPAELLAQLASDAIAEVREAASAAQSKRARAP